MSLLPKPEYYRDPADPDWLAFAAQFHGHLGPWAAAGFRAGACGRNAISANGFFDLDVIVEGPFATPPRSCFLDGIQVSSGATWGKRNITWNQGDEIIVRIKNTRTGTRVESRPTPALLEILGELRSSAKVVTSEKPEPSDDHEEEHNKAHVEELARQIARMPGEQLFQMTILPSPDAKDSVES